MMTEQQEQRLGKQIKVARRVFSEFMSLPNPVVFEDKLNLEMIKLGKILVEIYGDKLACRG
jgi:hypothetical protein